MRKQSVMQFLALILCGLFFISIATAQHDQSNVISADTTWTKENSPYTLTSSLTVTAGVTLTIEPGVTVNLNGGSLQVDGALIAKGILESKVAINGGTILLTSSSSAWDPQTCKGCIVENALLTGVSIIVCNSAKINGNTISGCDPSCVDGTIVIGAGTPIISDNTIIGGGYPRSIFIGGGSPQITDNYLVGGIYSNSSARHSFISENIILGPVIIAGGTPEITHNTITGRPVQYFSGNGTTPGDAGTNTEITGGIGMTGYNFGEDKLYNAIITDNTIVGGLEGIGWNAGPGAIIKNNLIANFTRTGLSLGSNAVVSNNTITNNKVGIKIFNFNGALGESGAQITPTIIYNNIMNSDEYNIYSYCSIDLDIGNNWWGTTDEQAIERTIYDNTYDQILGKFNIIPYLTEANSEAYPSTSGNQIDVQPTPNSNQFTVESNSTVSALTFNGTTPKITFSVSGPDGTTGYVKATISKNFMPNGDNITVYLDENMVAFDMASDKNSWIITFTYHHSLHHVRISENLTTTVPIGLGGVIFTALLIVVVLIPVLCIAVWFVKEHKAKVKP